MELLTFAQRFRYFRESYLNIGVREMARQCQLSPPNISSWESGSLPSIALVSKVYDTYPRLSPAWLEKGKGEMLKDISDQSGVVALNPEVKPNLSREEELKSMIEKQEKMIEWLQARLETTEVEKAKFQEEYNRMAIEREKLVAFLIDQDLVKKFLTDQQAALAIIESHSHLASMAS